MIRSLSGRVTHLTVEGIILDVNGVGYGVAVPLRSLPTVGSAATYFTHHHVREEIQALYGFITIDELAAFERLLSVPSVGPKTALAILSAVTPEQLANAVERDDLAFFQSVPGIGRKSAAKIIIELKGTLVPGAMGGVGAELLAALEGLGYRAQDVQPVLRELPTDVDTVPAQLQWVLQRLAQR